MRCWKIKDEVGFSKDIDDVCLRCYKVLEPESCDHQLSAMRFDYLYSVYRERGFTKDEAVAEACTNNRDK